MKLLKQYEHVLVDLQMTALGLSLGAHHIDEVIIPLFPFTALLLRASADLYDSVIQPVTVKSGCTYHILHLPHVKQVLGYILLPQFFLNEHIKVL